MEEIKKDIWIKTYHGEYGKEIVRIEILTDSKEQAYKVKEYYKELIKKALEK